MKYAQIAFGGGCHWCTEAIFQSLKGVKSVEQGYVASNGKNESFSEAVIVNFNSDCINLKTLIEIHLHTHKSTSDHSMRTKYRSAVYVFSEEQHEEVNIVLTDLNKDFNQKLITKVLPFIKFKASREQIRNYYYKNPTKPFCEEFINPKLKLLIKQFKKTVDMDKVNHLI
ncbi:peptide-methionine (S)-S-oxide reductase [Aureibaculum sp. 2210JD6-5]|uniref:peptide-methionine (S)-S-oxide reductase n=1 Tax=Aureibaculum sp. 2210JD6-5 TaxID=3103957 RepID=UPI002AAD0961|nr:peptide-methionine (S)-S-oxide reductase [Aureibaculum sp. 2210JD6-5]MDY7394951.1 peptide-methionine (S)-S-oxide reductase [Aureibaculum sp. 2210JD6-5]